MTNTTTDAAEARANAIAAIGKLQANVKVPFYADDKGVRALAEFITPHRLGQIVDAVLACYPATAEAASGAGEREVHSDDVAVDLFAAQMKAKLAAARAKGRHGWDDPAQCSTDYLRHLLHEHVGKGDPVDVANFCMMLAHYGASTAVPVDDQDREPTRRMLTAGASAAFDGPWPDNTAAIWRAMWDARTASLPPATDPAMVEAACERSWEVTHATLWRHLSREVKEQWAVGIIAALAAAPTIPATGEAVRKGMTAEWCLNMARLEEGQEVGAGMPDHPLRLKCELPPAGWLCTREPGHVGPCATIPATGHAATEGEGA